MNPSRLSFDPSQADAHVDYDEKYSQLQQVESIVVISGYPHMAPTGAEQDMGDAKFSKKAGRE